MKRFQLFLFALALVVQVQWLSAQNNPWVGQNIDGGPSAANLASVQSRNGGRHIDIVEHWADWNNDPFSSILSYITAIYNNGSIMELGFQPKDGGGWITNAQINNGQFDAFLHQYARDVAAWGKPIWFRLMHEMNADWMGWSPGLNGNTNTSFINAWKHVVDIFRAEGANNVKWVYSVNLDSHGAGNTFTSMYPGNAYVDYNSIDLYNWGTNHDWSHWTMFADCINSAYNALAPYGMPINISEWGCVENGGSKANWITDAFNQIRNSGNYNMIQAAIWFDTDYNPDNFQLASSTAALNAYIAAVNFASPPIPGTSNDTQAPSTPTGLTTNPISSGLINLSWTASTDNAGVNGYKIYCGGIQIATSSTTSYSNTGLAGNTNYCYTVAAYDAVGNTSAQSSQACATTPAGSSNLALGKSATASFVTGNNTANMAVDGNATDTRWESDYVDPSWIYVDLGDTYSINRVVLKWEDAYADQYKIQVSNDGSSWTDVYSTTTGEGDTDDISFTATIARYVRVYGTHRGTTYAYSIWEFEVYSPATGINEVALQPEVSSVTLYPNPLSIGGDLQLFVNGFGDDDINVIILDMSGKVIYCSLRKLKAGEIISLPAKLASGFYVVTIKGQNQVKQQKLIVI